MLVYNTWARPSVGRLGWVLQPDFVVLLAGVGCLPVVLVAVLGWLLVELLVGWREELVASGPWGVGSDFFQLCRPLVPRLLAKAVEIDSARHPSNRSKPPKQAGATGTVFSQASYKMRTGCQGPQGRMPWPRRRT